MSLPVTSGEGSGPEDVDPAAKPALDRAGGDGGEGQADRPLVGQGEHSDRQHSCQQQGTHANIIMLHTRDSFKAGTYICNVLLFLFCVGFKLGKIV